jgi:hypothetical protein
MARQFADDDADGDVASRMMMGPCAKEPVVLLQRPASSAKAASSFRRVKRTGETGSVSLRIRWTRRPLGALSRLFDRWRASGTFFHQSFRLPGIPHGRGGIAREYPWGNLHVCTSLLMLWWLAWKRFYPYRFRPSRTVCDRCNLAAP